jgi:hypothetical protein
VISPMRMPTTENSRIVDITLLVSTALSHSK